MKQTKEKIFFITSSYPYGNGEGFLEPEIEFLSNHFEVHLLPCFPRGKIRQNHQNEKIYLHSENLISFKIALITLLFAFLSPLKFVKIIKKSIVKDFKKSIKNLATIPKAIFIKNYANKNPEFKFLYAHWLSAPMQLALHANMITGIPFGATGHRWDLIENNNFNEKFSKASFVRLISKKSLTLLPSEVCRKYSSIISVIYMGVDNSFLKLNFLPAPEKNIICVANLIELKGHKYLFQALKILKDKGYSYRLYIYGDGPLAKELQGLAKILDIESLVFFESSVPHVELLSRLRSGKYGVMCLPSLDLGNGQHEGVPVSLMEAMSCGIPCISTNTGSISELIQNGKTGILVEPGNSEEIAFAILNLLEDNIFWNDIRHQAHRNLLENFSANLNNKKILELIQRNIK